MRTTLGFSKYLVLSALAIGSTAAHAQWNIKLAKQLVRTVKINLMDSGGTPLASTDLQMSCTGADPVQKTTDSNGLAVFGLIKQGSDCAISVGGKVVRTISFSEFEPQTVAHLEMDVKVSTNPKKLVVKNQINGSSAHRLDVYLYKNNKRMKAMGRPIAISCLGNGGAIYSDEKKASFPFAKATFENIPYGSECFVRTQKCSTNLEPGALIDFKEVDHTVITRANIHINIPICRKKDGTPEEGEDADENDDDQPTSKSGSHATASNGDSDDDTASTPTSSDSSTGKSSVAESKNPYQLIVLNQTTGSKIANQVVTVYEPTSGKTISAVTDANGEAKLNENVIQAGVEYLVFLGSESNPIATLNMVSKVTYTEADRTETAPFSVGSIRHHFPQNGYQLDPASTTIAELDQLALVMKQYPKLRITIEGYTNSDADQAYNMRLSRLRAEAMETYLTEKGGVDSARIEVKYFGETALIQNSDGTEDKEASRRVEVKPNWDSMLLN